ncbi:hypothetical protein [Endozoicomonas sp.]|uniref:hypothetical protein n=1 Tax=Endozoicomonas sp. TaxID=1892382 RepID=UPI0028870ABF|nr:hypothetical protein [Endozoicomonas sp.]
MNSQYFFRVWGVMLQDLGVVSFSVGYLSSVNDYSPGMYRGPGVVACGTFGIISGIKSLYLQYRESQWLSSRDIAVLTGNASLAFAGMVMFLFDRALLQRLSYFVFYGL